MPEPRKLSVKVADLDFEIARHEGGQNFSIFFEDGQSRPISDMNTILLWEILKTLDKSKTPPAPPAPPSPQVPAPAPPAPPTPKSKSAMSRMFHKK